MKKVKTKEMAKSIAAHGGIILFFVMAFEVMVMISPFAFFFYSVFNPFFHWLDQYAATRWLTSFFLPHMILPPTLILKSIRVLGSAFFIIGFFSFAGCALQVYLGKIFKWGIAEKGLYKYIRHPQYLALATWGTGMAILWPRFIVLATLALMFILYYFLAKDEERRMIKQYGEPYRQYMKNSGMFFPRFVEKCFSFTGRYFQNNSLKYLVASMLILTVVIGIGFVCRGITLRSLAFQARNNLTLVPILPEDSRLSVEVLDGIFRHDAENKIDFLQDEIDYLGYLMPADYIMQGMIANTGSEFHLYKKHHTLAMIIDWVLHPFEHLRRPPSVRMAKMHNVDPAIVRRHHCPVGINNPDLKCENCPYRRVIIVEIQHECKKHISGVKLFSFDTIRTPVGFIDINAQTGEIVNIKLVEKATAWKDVPTPAI